MDTASYLNITAKKQNLGSLESSDQLVYLRGVWAAGNIPADLQQAYWREMRADTKTNSKLQLNLQICFHDEA